MAYIVGVFIVLGIVMVVAGVYSQKALFDKTLSVYRRLADKRKGKISELPFKLGAMSALEFPVEGGTAYFVILPKQINFFVVSPELKNYIPLWITDAKTVRPGSFKLGHADFDGAFRIWKGPEEEGVIQNKFNRSCQKELLGLKEEVIKKARNIFIELIHVKPRDDTFSLKIDNYLVNRRFFQVNLEPLSVYESILDRCISVYEAFRNSGKLSAF